MLTQMSNEMESFSDFSPTCVTSLTAGFVAASNAVQVVLKASATARAQLTGFTTGMLFSGFFMSI